SSAYATEEILRVLIPAVGVAAFSLVVPLTGALLGVLALLILSYRQTIKAYPSAGGAYVVTKDNFGIGLAQVSGVALLIGYILTVAVSVAAGAAALASAIPALADFVVPIALFFILIVSYGNLRGVRESGKLFAAPTYFFMINIAVLLVVGAVRLLAGDLPQAEVEAEMIPAGVGADDLLFYGAGLFVILRAFASGGAAVTGVEAISNGVPAFREPSWRNARTTLLIMGSALGVMFLGISILAAEVQARPFVEGTPTVLSQIGDLVYGQSAGGHLLYLSLQAGTVLILVLASNTSYADFPRLASFAAGDAFLPRQLTKRGHRLVFSNGIIALSAVSVVLVIATQAKVERLIPLYAIGVFTGFTLSQAGMARHHLRHKAKGWRRGLLINGVGAAVSLGVALITGITKFTEGAWVVLTVVPLVVWLLFRLNKQYVEEETELEHDAQLAAEAPILRRHVVIVLVDRLDVAAARAIQYARTLAPDELRAVHFDLDPLRTSRLAERWRSLGLTRLTLDLVECQDRRITRAAAEVAAQALVDGETEVSVLIPRREYRRFWHRLLHDRTSDKMAATLSSLPHCNVTIVPYHLGRRRTEIATTIPGRATRRARAEAREDEQVDRLLGAPAARRRDGSAPIAGVRHRDRVLVEGRVRSLRVQPWAGVSTLECTLEDDTGALTVVFLGRRHVPGIETGVTLTVSGVVGEHNGNLAILNPVYELHASAGAHQP
ncbi:MAG: amino acid permease, partial [Acidimicrobiales bacterium]|nr:amino acid permease [Acidimicrobiales bacterium]